MRLWLLLILITSTQLAHADPVALTLSAGAGAAKIGETADQIYYSYGKGGAVAELQLEAGLRVHESVVVGGHLSAVSMVRLVDGFDDHGWVEEGEDSVRTVQYGLSAQIAVHERVWIAPWVGLQDVISRHECSRMATSAQQPLVSDCTPGSLDYNWDHALAAGLSVGVDVLARGEHRLSIVAAVMRSTIADASYTNAWLGVAYRYWP